MKNIVNTVVALAVILFCICMPLGIRHLMKMHNEIVFLKGKNVVLNSNLAARDTAIAAGKIKVDSLERELVILKADYNVLSDEKTKVIRERDKALAQLQTITADSSYRFLQEVAYAYPGVLRYLFNELQVRGIHRDYIKLQASTGIITTLEGQVNNCGLQVKKYELIKAGMEAMVSSLTANVDDYKKVVDNDAAIIKAQDKVIKKEHRRKNFWRGTTGAGILVIIGLIL